LTGVVVHFSTFLCVEKLKNRGVFTRLPKIKGVEFSFFEKLDLTDKYSIFI
jgi:hypothetical protein